MGGRIIVFPKVFKKAIIKKRKSWSRQKGKEISQREDAETENRVEVEEVRKIGRYLHIQRSVFNILPLESKLRKR